MLGACGGGSEPLTTEEYADALVEAQAELEKRSAELQEESVADLSDTIGANQEARRLPASSEWSEDDLERASEIATTLLDAGSRIVERSVSLLRPFSEDISGLRPPGHLARPHDAMVEALERILTESEQARSTLEDLDPDIENHEELRTLLERLGTAFARDETSQAFNEACFDVKDQLEAELGRDLAICD